MEAIAAAPGRWIIDWKVQVVTAEEPLECTPGFFTPKPVGGNPIGDQAGRYHCLGLDRLLIEARPLAALRIKTVGTDGDVVPGLTLRTLQFGQPA